jgi:ABC-type amino acid transport system permease subunit
VRRRRVFSIHKQSAWIPLRCVSFRCLRSVRSWNWRNRAKLLLVAMLLILRAALISVIFRYHIGRGVAILRCRRRRWRGNHLAAAVSVLSITCLLVLLVLQLVGLAAEVVGRSLLNLRLLARYSIKTI